MIRFIFFGLFIQFSLVYGQQNMIDDTSWKAKPKIELSGFLDAFYVFDFNQPTGNSRQDFLFNHNRHNEFNINLAYLKMSVLNTKYRGNLAFHTGTYVIDNYTSEPGLLKHVFEANIGLSLNKKNNTWLDVGIFPSHIGFESAITSDNWTLTRSILAENSPYFLTGAKVTRKISDKLEMSGLVLNGWQRIQRLQGNSLLSFGSQLKYTTSKSNVLNWSTFIGTDDPDSLRRMRYFSNFYGQFQLSKKLGMIAGFDIGIQQKKKHSKDYNVWFSPVVIMQYKIKENWKTAIRLEYYQDIAGVLIQTNSVNGFKTIGSSWNIDYSPVSNLLFRIEARYLKSDEYVLMNQKNQNLFLATSLSLKF